MKNLLLLTLILQTAVAVNAQDTLKVGSKIDSVTVFLNGAEITRNITGKIAKGRTVLLVEGLSSKIDTKTVKVSGSKNLTIVSVSNHIEFLKKKTVLKQIELLKNRQIDLADSINLMQKILGVYSSEKSVLESNKSIGGNAGVKAEDIKTTAQFFRDRLTEIETKTMQTEIAIRKMRKTLVSISQELAELNVGEDLPSGMVQIVVASEISANAELQLSYFIADASWTPSYDIRVSDIDKPIHFIYKAVIKQNTDEKWDKVKLTLSTGDPSESAIEPELVTQYLPNTSNATYSNSNTGFTGTVYGKVTSNDDGSPMPGVNILVKGTTLGTVTDENGNFVINAPSRNSVLVASFVGMQTAEVLANQATVNVALNSETSEVDDVVVTAMGISRDQKSLGYSSTTISGEEINGLSGKVAGIQVRGNSSYSRSEKSLGYSAVKVDNAIIPMVLDEKPSTREYKISIPYTIPSDNKDYEVTMSEPEIAANFEYSCVPKMSESVFLSALISDPQIYELLSGQANLFFKDTYIGKSFLDLKSFTDTLKLSFGKDNDIFVKREKQEDFSKTSVIGSNKKEERAWQISVRSHKRKPVTVNVYDQIPVSRLDKIKVETIELSEARYDEKTGQCKWKFELKPEETKKIDLKYSVKFPKDWGTLIR
jgi:hypothetical protein